MVLDADKAKIKQALRDTLSNEILRIFIDSMNMKNFASDIGVALADNLYLRSVFMGILVKEGSKYKDLMTILSYFFSRITGRAIADAALRQSEGYKMIKDEVGVSLGVYLISSVIPLDAIPDIAP